MNLLLPFARRFVAGRHADEAIEAVRQLNSDGVIATLDILGESVRDKAMAQAASKDYQELLNLIESESIDANVSLKLSQMGLDINPETAFINAERVVAQAKAQGNFVRIDMEGSDLTDATLAVFWRLREKYDNVGIVLQAYLHRTKSDLEKIVDKGGSVRICKGAYKEPKEIAYQDMRDIRRNFIELLTMAFEAVAKGKNVYPAVATHDDALIEKAQDLSRDMRLQKDSFEFQMLYGLRRKLAVKLARQGYKVRSYVPYGDQWFPYFYRRLRERKENVFFILSNLFKD